MSCWPLSSIELRAVVVGTAVMAMSMQALGRAPATESAPHVVGYFAEWNDTYAANAIPGDLVTHVNYSFARVYEGGIAISIADPNKPAGTPHPSIEHFKQLAALKAKYPQLKTLISVGGWGASKGFSEAAADDAARAKFAKSCAAFAREHGFDGVDIDWEFPGQESKADIHNFTLLLAAMRAELDAQAKVDGHPYLLTIAASAGPAQYSGLELRDVAQSVDWMNLMGYDLNGAWSVKTDFNAALFAPKAVDGAEPNGSLSVDAAVKDYLAAGVPKEKLVVGVPFYGQAWSGVGPTNHGLFQPHAKETPKPKDGGDWTYRAIHQQQFDVGNRRHWNDVAKVPWFYDPMTKVMVSYEDPMSMTAKGSYARVNTLGGVMIWELSQDDEESSLLKSLVAGLKGKP